MRKLRLFLRPLDLDLQLLDLLHGRGVFLLEDLQSRTVTLGRVPALLHFVLDLLQTLVQKFNLSVFLLQDLLMLHHLKIKHKIITNL